MKFLVLNYEYPPVGGGGGRLCEKLCEALAARGHSLRVVTAGLSHLPSVEERKGVRILRPQSFRRREDTCSVPEMALYLLTAFPTALREAWTWKPDVVHAHFVVPSGVLALVLKWLAGRPYLITAHLGDVPGGVPEQTAGLFRLASPVAKLVWHQAAKTTAVSTYVSALAARAWQRTPEVILNGIPAIPQKKPSRNKRTLRILMAGRLSIQKNPLLAIEALARIKDCDFQLEVVGDGPLAVDMKSLAEKLGISSKVVWNGWLDEEHVHKKMRESDVLLMTSHHEGLPMVAVEALWHGLAIVGTRIGGLLDVIEDRKNGFLCEPDPSAIASALQKLGTNPELLESAKMASLNHATRFDFETCVAAYEKALTRCSKSHSGS